MIVGTVWAPIGPSPLAQNGRPDNGLTSAIAVNPNNPNVIYQGTAGGGVWRTRDGGTTWTPLFDQQISLGIGNPSAIAIDPNDTNTIYVGSSSRLTPQATGGVFKSTDGGASWIRLGGGYPEGNVGDVTQFFNRSINAIIVDPADSQTLYLASTVGVFRSTNGGLDWGGAATNSAGDVRSLQLDTTSPVGARILYAGITNRGVLQSIDGAVSFPLQILGAATPQVAAAVGAGSFSKVVVALAPPTSPPAAGGVQVLYTSLSGNGGAPDPVGLFVSTDQGATWTQQGAIGIPGNTQGGYSFHMAVDPASPGDGVGDTIYLGTVNYGRSTDSGTNFTALNGLHADCQSWAFAPLPGGGSTVFCGNDGGIFRSDDGGTTWNARNGGGLQSALFYNMAVRPDATASVTLGAMQDNGVQTTSGGVADGWISPQGGDGWDVAYDGVTAGRAYATSGFWPAPCTRVFLSTADGSDLPPTVPSAAEITPWGLVSDQGCYLASVATDPTAAGIVYVAGNQNLWQSRDGGATWNNLGAFAAPGLITGRASVAPSNGNNVVVAVANQVSVSTNALGPVAGVTFANITRNLPARNVLRAGFDPNDPNVIYAVLGGFNGAGAAQAGHVFRTTISGTTWTDISPDLDVPHGALALDGNETPTTIYVGTDLGVLRSVDQGATWYVLDDLHFPNAPVTDLEIGRGSGVLRAATYGRGVFEFTRADAPTIAVNLQDDLDFGTGCDEPRHLTLQIFNVGNTELTISSVQRLIGSPAFEVESLPSTPLIVAAGEEVDFTVTYAPSSPGSTDMATIRITSDDPNAPYVDLLTTATTGAATAEVVIADSGDFGDVCVGDFLDRDLVVNNAGDCRLDITGIASDAAQFLVPDVVSFPLHVAAGTSIAVPLRFEPTAFGSVSATVSIASNDPASPAQIEVQGATPPPRLATSIADSGDFGDVCVGDFLDRDLVVNNAGDCRLDITGIASDAAQFLVPDVVSFPLHVAAGTSIAVPLRFEPTAFGSVSATVSIASNDPASPAQIEVQGATPPPRLVTSIADSGDFGDVCVGDFHDLALTLSNSGGCPVTITDMSSSSIEFLVPSVVAFPIRIEAGSSTEVSLRFEPTSFGPKDATITITSDDPASPSLVGLSGEVPSGTLAITGTTEFGAVELGTRALQSISICNVGECDLQVTAVGFKPLGPCQKYRHRCRSGCSDCACKCGCDKCRSEKAKDYDDGNRHDCGCDQKCLNFEIVTNPFPTTVHPGSCLDVLIQYIPTCDNSACCELLIETDDPDNSSHTLLVTGHLKRTLHSALKCWLGQQLQDVLDAGKGCP